MELLQSRESRQRNSSRIQLSAISLIVSGIFFTMFPIIRPFFDESSPQAAQHFSSNYWVIAHSFGMGGFVLLCLGLVGFHLALQETHVERSAFWAMILGWIGAGLTLPFFGAEAFSLQVIGRAAIDQNNPALLSLVNQVRFGPGVFFISLGLLFIAASMIILAIAAWRSGLLPKWSGIPIAIGFAIYIPLLSGQPVFQSLRIADGLLILASCIWIASGMFKRAATQRTSSPSMAQR